MDTFTISLKYIDIYLAPLLINVLSTWAYNLSKLFHCFCSHTSETDTIYFSLHSWFLMQLSFINTTLYNMNILVLELNVYLRWWGQLCNELVSNCK